MIELRMRLYHNLILWLSPNSALLPVQSIRDQSAGLCSVMQRVDPILNNASHFYILKLIYHMQFFLLGRGPLGTQGYSRRA